MNSLSPSLVSSRSSNSQERPPFCKYCWLTFGTCSTSGKKVCTYACETIPILSEKQPHKIINALFSVAFKYGHKAATHKVLRCVMHPSWSSMSWLFVMNTNGWRALGEVISTPWNSYPLLTLRTSESFIRRRTHVRNVSKWYAKSSRWNYLEISCWRFLTNYG